MNWSELKPARKTDFAFGIAALVFIVAVFFFLGGTSMFYSLDPMLAVLGFLFFGVLYFVCDAYFGELWGR